MRIQALKTDTVRPLKPAFKWRPIIAVNHRKVMTEDGEVFTHNEFISSLDIFPSAYVITYGASTLLHRCHRHWEQDPRWQWRVNQTENVGVQRIAVQYFGFRRPNGRTESRLHYVVDYNSFLRTHEQAPALAEMVTLAQELREFCEDMGIRMKSTAAGTMAQLLRHPDFYPRPRRRVPDFINEVARAHLPGNHYRLYADTGQRIEAATYIDQAAAHHHAVATTPLPNANTLTCQGYDRERSKGKVYARYSDNPNSLFRVALRQHGLFKVRIHIPHLHKQRAKYALPIAQRGYGYHTVYVWSNEIRYLQSLGVHIDCIYALWGTDEIDTGLPKFAKFAMDIQDRYPWLKTALLTVYGSLALNPRPLTVHYRDSAGNEDKVTVGPELLASKSVTLKPQSLTVNVVQRGLIESHVRALSLDMARQCAAHGAEVMSIYADGIFLHAPPGTQLPLMDPWRTKQEVTQLEYECATRLRSREITRLPGTSKFQRDYQEVY